MLNHIAVGVDFSPNAEEALAFAVSLARRNGAKVTMISVTTLPAAHHMFPRAMEQAAVEYTHRSNELLAKHRADLESLRQRVAAGSVEISTLIVPGFADREVAATAAQIGADLVIVGTHGRGFWSRLMVGSVAERTARAFERSVLITRGDHHKADGGFRRILVATDLSAQNAVIFERALALAAPGAEIEIASAWQDPLQAMAFDPAVTIASGTVWPEVEESIYTELRGMIRKHPALADRQPAVAARALFGNPAQAIVERAQEIGANLVVVGSHSHRGLARFLLGSTAEAVLRHAPCAVLVAR